MTQVSEAFFGCAQEIQNMGLIFYTGILLIHNFLLGVLFGDIVILKGLKDLKQIFCINIKAGHCYLLSFAPVLYVPNHSVVS